MSRRDLTTTSYAILGFLAIQPWTTYELAQQMQRTLNRTWPRARSKLFEEPKKLVEHGLAEAAEDSVGKRPRTVYTITPAGRQALASWLGTPSNPMALESEHLVKLFFADHGSTEDARATVDAARAWAREHLQEFATVSNDYLEGGGPFPQREAVNVIGARFLVDFYATVLEWADWAESVMSEWPPDPGRVTADREAMRELNRRARAALDGLGDEAPRRSLASPAAGEDTFGVRPDDGGRPTDA